MDIQLSEEYVRRRNSAKDGTYQPPPYLSHIHKKRSHIYYSKEFRECVVQDIIQIFKIGSDTLSRWLKMWRAEAGLSTPERGRYNSRRFSDEVL